MKYAMILIFGTIVQVAAIFDEVTVTLKLAQHFSLGSHLLLPKPPSLDMLLDIRRAYIAM